MAYGAVRHHDGILTLDSRVGAGTTATMTIPASESTPEPEGELVAPIEAAPGGTILLVDDERMVRRSGARLLKRLGYSVLLAEDGEAALEIYAREQEEIELVILDVAMPIMDGIECFNRLRQMNPHVRVLLCSGFPSGHQVEKALAAGGAGFLSKPFERWQFAKAIARALGE
jgi:CheY-like chemotaxis protein